MSSKLSSYTEYDDLLTANNGRPSNHDDYNNNMYESEYDSDDNDNYDDDNQGRGYNQAAGRAGGHGPTTRGAPASSMTPFKMAMICGAVVLGLGVLGLGGWGIYTLVNSSSNSDSKKDKDKNKENDKNGNKNIKNRRDDDENRGKVIGGGKTREIDNGGLMESSISIDNSMSLPTSMNRFNNKVNRVSPNVRPDELVSEASEEESVPDVPKIPGKKAKAKPKTPKTRPGKAKAKAQKKANEGDNEEGGEEGDNGVDEESEQGDESNDDEEDNLPEVYYGKKGNKKAGNAKASGKKGGKPNKRGNKGASASNKKQNKPKPKSKKSQEPEEEDEEEGEEEEERNDYRPSSPKRQKVVTSQPEPQPPVVVYHSVPQPYPVPSIHPILSVDPFVDPFLPVDPFRPPPPPGFVPAPSLAPFAVPTDPINPWAFTTNNQIQHYGHDDFSGYDSILRNFDTVRKFPSSPPYWQYDIKRKQWGNRLVYGTWIPIVEERTDFSQNLAIDISNANFQWRRQNNFIDHIVRKEKVVVFVAGNSGLALGKCGKVGNTNTLNINEIKASHNTQEEDIVSSWIYGMLKHYREKNWRFNYSLEEIGRQIYDKMIWPRLWGISDIQSMGNYGNSYGGQNRYVLNNPHRRTIQGVDYTNITEMRGNEYKYADAWVLNEQWVARKKNRGIGYSYDEHNINSSDVGQVSLVWVAGPNADQSRRTDRFGKLYSTTYNTRLPPQLANDYNYVLESTRYALRAGIDALINQNLEKHPDNAELLTVIIPCISCGIYGMTNNVDRNRFKNNFKRDVIEHVLKEAVGPNKENRGEYLHKVIFVNSIR